MKFKVKDECGAAYEIEEVEETKDEDVAQLTAEEITALKSLAAVANDIIDLLKVEKEEHQAVTEDDGEDLEKEDDEDEEIEKEEIVVDTKSKDSKKSMGSVENKSINDSLDSEDARQMEICKAWANRK